MKKLFAILFSITVFFVIWQILFVCISSALIVPSIKEVFFDLIKLLKTFAFWKNLLFTLLRIFLAFFITVFTGLITGWFCGKYEFFDYFLSFPLNILKTTPVSALILILLFAFNSSVIPVISAVLMGIPVINECVKNAVLNDKKQIKLYEMAEIFEFTSFQKFKYIFFKDFLDFFKSGIISTFSMTFKVCVAGEILTLPKSAVGTILYKEQINLETSKVIAATICLVFISFLLEGLLKWLLKSKN